MQMEKHIFWDCKLTRSSGQPWGIFCLRTAKNFTQSRLQSPFKARRKKISTWRPLLHKQLSYIYLKIDM
jgi:hypothetical protein